MANESMVGKAQTVLGAIEPSALGIARAHERPLERPVALFAPPSGKMRRLRLRFGARNPGDIGARRAEIERNIRGRR